MTIRIEIDIHCDTSANDIKDLIEYLKVVHTRLCSQNEAMEIESKITSDEIEQAVQVDCKLDNSNDIPKMQYAVSIKEPKKRNRKSKDVVTEEIQPEVPTDLPPPPPQEELTFPIFMKHILDWVGEEKITPKKITDVVKSFGIFNVSDVMHHLDLMPGILEAIKVLVV